MREYKAIFICILIAMYLFVRNPSGKQITHMKRKVIQEHKRFVNDRYD